MSKLKRYVDELKESKSNELEIIDKGIVNFQDVPGICKFLSNFSLHYHSSLITETLWMLQLIYKCLLSTLIHFYLPCSALAKEVMFAVGSVCVSLFMFALCRLNRWLSWLVVKVSSDRKSKP